LGLGRICPSHVRVSTPGGSYDSLARPLARPPALPHTILVGWGWSVLSEQFLVFIVVPGTFPFAFDLDLDLFLCGSCSPHHVDHIDHTDSASLHPS
jgi:hypothetical protein